MTRHELRARPGQDPEAIATRWILRGWHSHATVARSRGPGVDLYGPYLGVWTGNVHRREWVTVIVR